MSSIPSAHISGSAAPFAFGAQMLEEVTEEKRGARLLEVNVDLAPQPFVVGWEWSSPRQLEWLGGWSTRHGPARRPLVARGELALGLHYGLAMAGRLLIAMWCAALTACAFDANDSLDCDDGKCDAPQTCGDPRYGNGACDLALDCAVPDIDCFSTFADDPAAVAWWAENEQRLLGAKVPIVPLDDPRYRDVRAALDRGWEAFRVARSVGKLAAARPALVILDRPFASGAFVAGDPMNNTQPFVVFVETAMLALDADPDGVLGIMLHELQHGVGLHLLGDRARFRRYYVAPPGSEPRGREQDDHAEVRAAGEAWRAAASEVGPYSARELGSLPISGVLFNMLAQVLGSALQSHPATCTNAAERIDAITKRVATTKDPIDGSLGDLAWFPPNVAAALAALDNDCLAGFPHSFIDVGAAFAGTTPAEFLAQLNAHDRALVEGKGFVAGLTALVDDRRAAMRATEVAFATEVGVPWSQLRYYSYEEDADEVSMQVMRAQGKDSEGVVDMFVGLLGAGEAKCRAQLAGLLPYGVDLTDEHHATCWRAGNMHRNGGAYAGRAAPTPAAFVGPSTPMATRQPGRLPTPSPPTISN